jgi:hypothetical protein
METATQEPTRVATEGEFLAKRATCRNVDNREKVTRE